MLHHCLKPAFYQWVSPILLLCGLLLWSGMSQVQAAAPWGEVTGHYLPDMPLYFVENRGQLDPQVNYYLQGQDKTLYFTPTGVTMALKKASSDGHRFERWVVKLDFVDGHAQPIGQAQTETTVSYFQGAPEQWQVGLSTYGQLRYSSLWPGIDLVYTLRDSQLKYQFIIQPGIDPAHIRLAYSGATGIHLDASGGLEVVTPAGRLEDTAPTAYQRINGRQVPVTAAYGPVTTTDDGQSYGYGFWAGVYDTTRPLVLDPAMILYAGFIGGSQRENGYSIAVDAAGSAYVTGETRSVTDFPAVVGPDLTHNGGPYNGDAFIAKVKADGSGLVYAGFIGGSGEDYGYGVAVDHNGAAYVTGYTTSNDFPVTSGSYDTIYNGGGDAFVAKVKASGAGLVYASYIGDVISPTTSDSGADIAVDGGGNAYVLVNSSFGPFGGRDTSVVKVNSTGSVLTFVEYIGGSSGDDDGDSLAVDGKGYTYVTGYTTASDFPTTGGTYDPSYNGGGDAFVAKVRSDGSGLVYATYIGDVVSPTTLDRGTGIAVDAGGNAYVLVNTSFGPIGGYDASVVKLNAAGSALAYVRHIGGSDFDFGNDLALDGQGRAYIAGETLSADFPTVNWPAYSFDGPQEAFAVRVKADGSGLEYAGFLTGRGSSAAGIAVDNSDNAYVTGTNWRGEDFPARVGPDVSANGERDAFVIKVSPWVIYLPIIMK